jgi:hypothetical protein
MKGRAAMMDEMPGIDGRNPLGFLAALGVLTIVGGKLGWRRATSNGVVGWTPFLVRDGDDRPLVATVVEALGIAPPRPPVSKKGGRPPLSAPPRNAIPFGLCLAERPFDDFKGDEEGSAGGVRFATAQTLRAALQHASAPEIERIVSHAAVTVVSKKGGPATSVVRSLVAGGQVRYLKTLREIAETVGPQDIEEAIAGPWRYRKGSKKTSLDPYSLIENVGKEVTELGAVSAIGAERLALEGLRSLPTAPHGRYVVTRGFLKRSLRWCLWDHPLSLGAIRVLLGTRSMYTTDRDQDRERESLADWAASTGVVAIYECAKFQQSKNYARLRRTQTLFEVS